MAQDLISNFTVKKFTIIINEALSAAVNIQGLVLIGIVMPADWTAANITFQGSLDNVTFNDVYDEDGVEIAWTGASASRVLLQTGTQPLLGGLSYLKIRSGVTATPVNQAAARTVELIFAVPNP